MVFAVVKNETNPRNDIVQDFYRNFASFIGQPNSVGELTEDVTVMEDLIKDKYRSITSEFICIQCSMNFTTIYCIDNFCIYDSVISGTIRVSDNTLDSDIKIKFKVHNTQDDFGCSTTQNGVSEGSIQCNDTTNGNLVLLEVSKYDTS